MQWIALLAIYFFQTAFSVSSMKGARLPKLDANNPMYLAGLMNPAMSAMRGMQNARYEKIGSDVRCDSRALHKAVVGTLGECQNHCTQDPRCKYIAYWLKRKYCETYATCDAKSADKENKIFLYKKVDECEEEIKDGHGRFYTLIAEQFPPGLIRSLPPRRNIACYCTAWNWMICAIFLVKDSGEYKAVFTRLDRSHERALQPFYLAYPDEEGKTRSPLMFAHEDVVKVYAEIEPLPFYRCATVEMCKTGTPESECPVYGSEFASGQAVFIMNTDEANAALRRPIPCISAIGIRVLATLHGHDTVMQQREVFVKHDPWGRQPGRDLIIGRDYIMIFIFDETDLRSGICGDDSYPAESDAETTTEEPFQPDPPETSSGKHSPRKKTRGGGKKKKKGGPPELEPGPLPGSPVRMESGVVPNSGFKSFIEKINPELKGPESPKGPEGQLAPAAAAASDPSDGESAEDVDSDGSEESEQIESPREPLQGPVEMADLAGPSSSGAAGSSDMHAGIQPEVFEDEGATDWNVVSRKGKGREPSKSKGKSPQPQKPRSAYRSPRARPIQRPPPPTRSNQQQLSPATSASTLSNQDFSIDAVEHSPRAPAPMSGRSSWVNVVAPSPADSPTPLILDPGASPSDSVNPSASVPVPGASPISKPLNPNADPWPDDRLDVLSPGSATRPFRAASPSISPSLSRKEIDSPSPLVPPTSPMTSNEQPNDPTSPSASREQADSPAPLLLPSAPEPSETQGSPPIASDGSSSSDFASMHRKRKEMRMKKKGVPASFLDDEPSTPGTSPATPISGESVVVSLDSKAAHPLLDKQPADRLLRRNYQSEALPSPSKAGRSDEERPPPVPRMQDKYTQWSSPEEHVSSSLSALLDFSHFFIFFTFCFIFTCFTSCFNKSSHDVYIEFKDNL